MQKRSKPSPYWKVILRYAESRLLICPVATLGIFLIMFCMEEGPARQSLAEHHVEITGRIVRKEPDNHKLVQYRYSVGQKTYFGEGGAGERDFDSIRAGDPIQLFFDPSNPGFSSTWDPVGDFYATLYMCIGGSLFFGIFLYITKIPWKGQWGLAKSKTR